MKAMQKQAKEMRKRARKHHGDLQVGEVVQYGLSDFDRTRVDYKNLTAMVVEVRRHYKKEGIRRPLVHPKYHIATKHGYLDKWLDRECLRACDTLTARPSMVSLDGVAELHDDRKLKPLTLRAIARAVSLVPGGQGMTRCNCEGDCSNRKCSCKRAGVSCNSRCHKGNCKCKNSGC